MLGAIELALDGPIVTSSALTSYKINSYVDTAMIGPFVPEPNVAETISILGIGDKVIGYQALKERTFVTIIVC